MDFYAHQDRAKVAARRLGALFVLALVAVVVAVNAAAALAWWLLGGGTNWPPYFVATNTTITLLIVLGGAWVEVHRLREGGSVLARRLGARSLDEGDALHRRLRDVVEEVAIGAGVPVPALHVLDEPSINALAAGESPSLAAIVVTRGALERLERAELQGVVAHEVAHIIGGDAALNTQMTGALYGLCSLRLAGQRMFAAAFARADDGALVRLGLPRVVMAVAGALLSAVGALGVGCAQLLRAGISRQREFLADAMAVQITRDRDGLGGALRRIAGEAETPLQSDYARLVSHFLLVQADGRGHRMHTHPPLAERIRRLYGRAMPPILRVDDLPRAARTARKAGRGEGHDGGRDGGREAGYGGDGKPSARDDEESRRARAEALELETIPFVRLAHPVDVPGFPMRVGAPGRARTTPGADAAAAAAADASASASARAGANAGANGDAGSDGCGGARGTTSFVSNLGSCAGAGVDGGTNLGAQAAAACTGGNRVPYGGSARERGAHPAMEPNGHATSDAIPASPAAPLISRIRAASLGYETAGRWLEALAGAAPIEEPDARLRAALAWVLSPAGAALRVPLLELLLARVRRWSSAHRRELLERCRRCVERDGRIDSSEWAYYTLARHRLLPALSNPSRVRKAPGSRTAQSRALAALFAMAAAIGEASARNTRDALADAAAMLEVLPPAATPDEVSTSELTQALDTLLGLPPLSKPTLLKSLRALARTPGDPDYEAFLRAVAAAIDCPVPRDSLPVAGVPGAIELAA